MEFNRQLGGCPTGQAKLSPGFNLVAEWIIHTVGPVWQGGKANEHELLRDCYMNSLKLALENSITSIAFPAISTGVYGYPKYAATQIAISVMREYESSFKQLTACCFSSEDLEIYETVIEESNI